MFDGADARRRARHTAAPAGPRSGSQDVPAYGQPAGDDPGRDETAEHEEGESLAPLAPVAGHGKRGGGRARTIAGIAAAAITTVLAVIIAGQVANGDDRREDPATGTAEIGRSDPAADTASRSGEGARAGAPEPSPSPRSYGDRMAEPFPLDPDLEGTGRFKSVGGHEDGPEGGKTYRYRVDVEKKLPLKGKLFAEAVHKTLNDKRSWAHDGERSFERVSGGNADFVITLASPGTTDKWCAKSGLDTSEQKVSCDSASTDRVMINGYRWARGAKTFGDDHMYSYRQMLINHEVGHRIGLGHVGCPKDGERAPVMMQQTKSLKTAGATCRANAWPHPDA